MKSTTVILKAEFIISVEAEDADDASDKAIKHLRNEIKLKALDLNDWSIEEITCDGCEKNLDNCECEEEDKEEI